MCILQSTPRIKEYYCLIGFDPALFHQMNLGRQTGGAFGGGEDAGLLAHDMRIVKHFGIGDSERGAAARAQGA
mgnify:CR=1 FL=1